MSDHVSMTFNGPLEAGLRAVAVLGTDYPNTYDLERLTAYDYLLVRTSGLGGPDDLHPNTPIQTPATQVRRKIVQDAIHMMMSRDLIERKIGAFGIEYCAGESASLFLDSLKTPYISELKMRAAWLTKHFANFDKDQFDVVMREMFDHWMMEFQETEINGGGTS